ncbi:hypothetical protein GGI04_005112 [Coemansia thaxteri]|nr:hypothetical protein GGI04_005112 [Coemansia thaxteri]
MSDESIAFSACLRFPRWGNRSVLVPYANATVFHNGNAVGWVCVNDLEVVDSKTNTSIHEIFHIVDHRALELLTSEIAASRRVAVSIRAAVDLSGFGRYLPAVIARHNLDIVLPSPPPVHVAVSDLSGPALDTDRGGVTARANIRAVIPARVAANIDALRFDIGYSGVIIASADVGPVVVSVHGVAEFPAATNVKVISDNRHEEALADMIRKTAAGKHIELCITGAHPEDYNTAPAWLRRALHGIAAPVNVSLPLTFPGRPPSIGELVKNVVVDRFYAFWSSEDSFNPRASIAGHALVSFPNPTGSDAAVDIESIVFQLEVLDQDQRAFAVVDTLAAPIRIMHTAPTAFNVSCDFDSLALSSVSGREQEFTRTMKRALVDRRLAVGINGTIDMVLMTPIGRLRIDMLPISTRIDSRLELYTGRDTANDPHEGVHILEPTKVPEILVSRIHITNTTEHFVAAEIGLDITNPLSYGAFISDVALMVRYSGLHVATVGLRNLSLERGQNNATVYVDFHNHPSDPRQQMFFLEASSGNKVTIELAGFPNCSSILPLEASLRNFTQSVTIDPSKVKSRNNGLFSVKLPRVLREVVFRIFSMTAEATVISPVSGADIWLQAIEAVGYYKGNIPLGTLQYNFISGTSKTFPSGEPKGFLLPFNQAVTTPRLPIAANETSIGWDVVRRAIGGTLDVDVFTNLQVLVGNAPLNLTVMGRGAPVKVRL